MVGRFLLKMTHAPVLCKRLAIIGRPIILVWSTVSQHLKSMPCRRFEVSNMVLFI